jgi:hypothetical protein
VKSSFLQLAYFQMTTAAVAFALLALVCALISSSEVLHLIQVERKKDNKDVEGTIEEPN